MSRFDRKPYYLFFFFIQPFFTLLYYLKNFRKPVAKNIMWLFTIFYGLAFSIGIESQGSDINDYINEIPLLHSRIGNVDEVLRYYANSSEVDYLRTTLSFLVSRFTANGYYLIIVYGLIFGYFFSRNMWYILDRLRGRTQWFPRILIFCLFLTLPIWYLNGFRFWTAAHVFLYGLFPFLIEGKKKPLIWCFIAPIIHFGFWVPLLPVGIYLILGNRVKGYFIFFVFTLFLNQINIQSFNNAVTTYTPDKLSSRVEEGYSNEEKVVQFREGGKEDVWYSKYYGKALNYTLFVFLIAFYGFYRKKVRDHKSLLRLFSFILLFFGMANLLASIPSGGRYLSVASLLAVSFFLLIFQNFKINKTFQRLSILSVPFLLLFIIVAIRIGIYSFSVMAIMGNPFLAIFTFGHNISINDLVKGFLDYY